MHPDGSLQRQPDRLTCPIRHQLEADLYSAIEVLAQHSSTLADIAGTGQPDLFIQTTRHCDEQRLLIHELEKQIASHRAEHGC